jgi:hypothetical protein
MRTASVEQELRWKLGEETTGHENSAARARFLFTFVVYLGSRVRVQTTCPIQQRDYWQKRRNGLAARALHERSY